MNGSKDVSDQTKVTFCPTYFQPMLEFCSGLKEVHDRVEAVLRVQPSFEFLNFSVIDPVQLFSLGEADQLFGGVQGPDRQPGVSPE